MYNGLSATLIRDMPYTALQFMFYEFFKKSFAKFQPTSYPHIPHKHPLTLYQEIISGGVAGMLAGAITTPLDVIKTILQTQRPQRDPFIAATPGTITSVYHAGVLSAFKNVYKRQGMKGLMSGLAPRVLWTGAQSTIMFVLYEYFVNAFM